MPSEHYYMLGAKAHKLKEIWLIGMKTTGTKQGRESNLFNHVSVFLSFLYGTKSQSHAFAITN